MSAGDVYGGIEVPEGDPDELEAAAGRVRATAGTLERVAGTLTGVLGGLGWAGPASVAHTDLTGSHVSMLGLATQALDGKAAVIADYAGVLRTAQRQSERAIADARDADRRIREAEGEIRDAEAAQRSAQGRIDAAQIAKAAADNRLAASVIDVVAGDHAAAAASAAEADEIRAAQGDLDQAQAKERRARIALRQAREDRRAAAQLGERAADDVRLARAGLVAAAQDVGLLPREPGGPASASFASAAGIALPPPPKPKEKEDKPWYEDAVGAVGDAASWTWGQAKQVPGGAWEGTKGLANGVVFISQLNPMSPDNVVHPGRTFDRYKQLAGAGKFAVEHPGEFGKQVINYEDLANGRYGEWAGNLLPDAVLAVTTAGAGTAASRAARISGDVADAATVVRRVDRPLTEAGESAVTRGDDVVRHWTPLDDNRPLAEDRGGNTFRSSTYDEVRTTATRRLYRVHSADGSPLGPFWTHQPPAGPTQSILDNALVPQWGNDATHVTVVDVPPGTTLYEGQAGPQPLPGLDPADAGRYAADLQGGGPQVFIKGHIPKEWIVHP